MRLTRTGNLVYDEELFGREGVFRDRSDAGLRLAEACSAVLEHADIVYAIPRGGVPVAVPVARALKAELDLLLCRKLLISWNREAGFGAVSPDGHVFVDEEFARMLGLSKQAVKEAVREMESSSRKWKGGTKS